MGRLSVYSNLPNFDRRNAAVFGVGHAKAGLPSGLGLVVKERKGAEAQAASQTASLSYLQDRDRKSVV